MPDVTWNTLSPKWVGTLQNAGDPGAVKEIPGWEDFCFPQRQEDRKGVKPKQFFPLKKTCQARRIFVNLGTAWSTEQGPSQAGMQGRLCLTKQTNKQINNLSGNVSRARTGYKD